MGAVRGGRPRRLTPNNNSHPQSGLLLHCVGVRTVRMGPKDDSLCHCLRFAVTLHACMHVVATMGPALHVRLMGVCVCVVHACDMQNVLPVFDAFQMYHMYLASCVVAYVHRWKPGVGCIWGFSIGLQSRTWKT